MTATLGAGGLLAGCSGSGGGTNATPSQAVTPSAISGPLAGQTGHAYLALGDSLAAASGASSPDRGYVPLLAAALTRQFGDELMPRNLSKAGATTQTLLDEQVPEAEAALRAGDVLLITIDIGGNDFAPLFGNQDCVGPTPSPNCPLASVLDPVQARLDTIFSRLRTAGPETPMAVLLYPNLFSGSGHPFEAPAAAALSKLDDVLRAAAARYRFIVVDPWDAFQGKSLQLTGVGAATFDPHPNDAGYAVLAQAMESVLLP